MYYKNEIRIFYIWVFIFSVLANCLYADTQTDTNDDGIIEMPEIIVNAERAEQTSKNSASTVNIISAKDIDKRNIYTFDQALEAVPGVILNRSAGTATNSMNIRGASEMLGGGVGNRVLLLIDGRPAITADTGGANWSLLPIDIIDRVEVVKGALSPLYGSNAMGGVVNLITKSPTDSKNTKFNIGAGYYEKQPSWMRYTDKRSYFGDVGIIHSNTVHNLGYLFSLGSKRSDGYRQNTDFSLYNAYGKIQYIIPKDRQFTLSLGMTSLDRGFPHGWLIDNEVPYIHPLKVAYESTNDRQQKNNWDVDLSFKTPINPKSKLTANIYRSDSYSKSLYNPNNMKGDNFPYGFFTDSNAIKSGGILQVDLYQFRNNYLIFGFDAQIDSVDSKPVDIMFGKHQAETLAGFIQDKIILMEKLSVMFGARYDYRHLETNSNEDQISPKLGLSYAVGDNTSFRFSIGQAFRAPSLAEIYMKQELNSGLEFKQNPNLKAEKLRLYAEAGLRHKLFNFLSNDTSIFIYDFSDMINWERIGENEFQVTNLNRSVIKGAETGISFVWKQLSATANYTYLDARDRTKGRIDNTLPYKPKHSAYTALDYEYNQFRIGVSLRYVSKVEEAMFYPNDAPKAFYVINTKLSYKINRHVILSIAVDNLMNRQYEEIERYRMTGRTIIFKTIVE
jgi:outer membrane cobalamin receptor